MLWRSLHCYRIMVMKTRRSIFPLCILLGVIFTPTFTSSFAQGDYQTTLLNYFTQQLIAHGAELFAAMMASFTFISRFIDKASNRGIWSVVVFVLIGGILLGLSIYIGVRLVNYGYLASATIQFENPPETHSSLQQYRNAVLSYLKKVYYITL